MVVQFAGYSNSGKTTLLTHLISSFTQRGLRVAVIKHDGGHDFEMDQEEKDTWRFREAGAPLIAIQSKTKSAWLDYSSVSLSEMIVRMKAASPDVIFIEGYKREALPKLILIKREEDKELLEQLENPIAIVSWIPLEHPSLPVFSIHDLQAVSQFILERFQACKQNQDCNQNMKSGQ